MLRRKAITQECEITGVQFSISPEDREAYEFFDLPLPSIAPSERLRHQLAFSSDQQLYWRRCSVSDKRIISIFPPNCPFPVVDVSYWRSEEFDARSFAQVYDFKQLFVEQLLRLWHEVPRPAVNIIAGDHSAFMHNVIEASNSSSLFNAAYCDRCMHSSQLYHCADCYDSHALSSCNWCYECIDLLECERLFWSISSRRCRESYFLANCFNCSHCLFCVNLEGAQYHVFNKPVSKNEYSRIVREWDFSSVEKLALARRSFHNFLQEYSVPECITDDPDTTSGNYLQSCHRTNNSFECSNCDNCIDCNFSFDAHNCLDGCGFEVRAENCAQSIGIGANARHVINSIACWDNVEYLDYCMNCENSRHLFACVGLRNAEYCILNKQYSKEEYERTRLSIVALLKERDIWGRFLPAQFSPFEYNHSLAQVLMPLAKVPAQLLGFRWDSSDPLVRPSQLKARMGTEYNLNVMSSQLRALSAQSASREVFLCELTGKPYTISSLERDAYMELGIAPPQRCPEQRFKDRMSLLAPRVLELRDGMNTAFPADWFRPVVPYAEWENRLGPQR